MPIPGLTQFNTRGSVSATFVVAAYNANSTTQRLADYLCDGTADEVQIAAALAALPASGGNIVLSEGTFNIAAAITMVSNVRLTGAGPGTVIYMTSGADLAMVINIASISNAEIAYLKIDSNGTNQASNARNIYISQSHDIVVDNCICSNSRTHAIEILGVAPSHDIRITDCTIEGFDIDDSSNDGISISDDQYNVVVHACHIYGAGPVASARSGIEIEDGAHDVTVGECILHDTTNGLNIHIHAGEPAVYGVVAQNNVVRDCTVGINVQGIDAANIYGVSFSGNVVTGNTNGYVLNRCRAVMIGNISFGNTLYGISLYKCNYCVVSGDWFYDNGNNGLILNDCDYCLVDGCQMFSNGGRGIDITASARCIISNNQVIDNDSGDTNTYAGIWIKGDSHYNTIEGNHCYVTVGGTYQTYGIQILANATGNIVWNNRLDQGGRTGNLIDGGTGTVIRNNIGFVTENSGTSTIVNPATSVVVAHGLAVTPTVDDISITLAENPTNDPGIVWVDTIGAANFTVNVRAAPGASDLDFGWRAEVL